MRPDCIRLGLIINPIAGMGGSVGLKGTDHMVLEAVERGAVPMSQNRTRAALQELEPLKDQLCIYTFAGDMGGVLAEEMGFTVNLLGKPSQPPCGADTQLLAKRLREQGAELILFAGGDGTARDLYNALGRGTPVAAIPAGVKIHSPVYAKKPKDAGRLAYLYLTGRVRQTVDAEVLDIDEDLYRSNQISTKLYGYLTIPLERSCIQNRKAPSPLSEAAAIHSIAHQVVQDMIEDTTYLIGAGTTTMGIMELLGLPNTLIGVDVVRNHRLVENDVYGKHMLDQVRGGNAKLVVTVTGGQGFLFGRGNQQITPEVIQALGRGNIIVVATKEKLFQLRGQPLLVDTGNPELDEQLAGYWPVITSYGERIICEVR